MLKRRELTRVVFDRQRQWLARQIYRSMWLQRKIAWHVFPDSDIARLSVYVDNGKVRFAYYRPYIGVFSEDLGMRIPDWHETVIGINKELENA